MHITITPAPVKVEPSTKHIVKVLMNRARKGTFYISGDGKQLSTKRSDATVYATKDDAYAEIAKHNRRDGLNMNGVMMTAVKVVKTRGESGGRD